MKNNILLSLYALISSSFAFADSLDNELGVLIDENVSTNANQKMIEPSHESGITRGGGVNTISYYPTDAANYLGRTSGFDGGTVVGAGDKNCLDGSTESFIDHPIKMEPNQVLDGIRVWGSDTNVSQDLRFILYKTCFPAFDAGSPVADFFFSEALATSGGDFSNFYNINRAFTGLNKECKIMARVRFGNSNSCNGIEDLRLFKVRAQLRSDDLIFIDDFGPFNDND